jgi:hypothetical protein
VRVYFTISVSCIKIPTIKIPGFCGIWLGRVGPELGFLGARFFLLPSQGYAQVDFGQKNQSPTRALYLYGEAKNAAAQTFATSCGRP